MEKIKDYTETTVGFCDPADGKVEIKGVHDNYGSVCLEVGQVYWIRNPKSGTQTMVTRTREDSFTVSAYKHGAASKYRQYQLWSN